MQRGTWFTTLKITAACGLLFTASAANVAMAQNYPTKAIHFTVGFAAGGGSDTSARVSAAAMEKLLGQPIIVENRPGAGSLIGAQYVAKSDADGYNILFGAVSGFHPVFLKEGLDAAKAFDPISNLQVGGLIFAAKPTAPFNSLQDMVAWSKANPGKLNFGSVAPQVDLYMAALKAKTGLDYTVVPYKGDAPLNSALLAGEVDLAVLPIGAAQTGIRARWLRPLALTGAARSSTLPDVATLAEQGYPGFETGSWQGLFVAAGTSTEVIARLQRAALAALEPADARERLRSLGQTLVGSSGEAFATRFKADVARFAAIVQQAGIVAPD